MKVVMSDHGCSAEIDGDCAICEVVRLKARIAESGRLSSLYIQHTAGFVRDLLQEMGKHRELTSDERFALKFATEQTVLQ
jgi:hypothetical protein